MPTKPRTMRESIDQIWFAIFGTNEDDGILFRIKRLESRPRNIFQTLKDIALLVMTIVVFLFGTGIIQ